MSTGTDIRLEVGEEAKIRSGFASSTWIAFAGMPNRDTYSVAIKWTSGNNSAAYNLFLPTAQTEFVAARGRVRVYSVSAREIRFRFQK